MLSIFAVVLNKKFGRELKLTMVHCMANRVVGCCSFVIPVNNNNLLFISRDGIFGALQLFGSLLIMFRMTFD